MRCAILCGSRSCRLTIDPPCPAIHCSRPIQCLGYDSGVDAAVTNTPEGKWELEIVVNWPAYVQLDVFRYDDHFYGDTDGGGILYRPPNSVAPNYVNMMFPPSHTSPGL